MLRLPAILTIVALLCVYSTAVAQTQSNRVSTAYELSQLYNISQLPYYRPNTIVAQTSTYDIKGGNDDGFNGTYSYVKRNADSSLVMFDVTGAGVINRIATPTPTDDTLDFYIDDTSKIAFSIKYRDLFSGDVYPFVHPLCGNQLGGFYCYYPITFNKSCRIVSRGKTLQFHQVQYRLYAPGTLVAEQPRPELAKNVNQLKVIADLWNKEDKTIADFAPGSLAKTTDAMLKPGETKDLFTSATGGTITGIQLNSADAYAGLNKDIDIKITWDDDATPAVYCPVADFFGYAFGQPAMQSLLLGSKNNINYCYYPMPFDKKATIQLIYRGSNKNEQAKHLQATIYYTQYKRDARSQGRFYSNWQGNAKPATGSPHVFVNTEGRGHYVATVLQAQGLKGGMTDFFEGDDSTAADGQFRIHGTGSEDYFNGGWYALPDRWENKFSLPLYGCLDYSLPLCRTGGYRLYLADKVSFEKSIYQSIEHGPEGNLVPVSYTSLSLYYCSTAPATYNKPANDITSIYLPDTLTLYPQLMHFNINGDMGIKKDWAYNTGGESFVFTAEEPAELGIPLEKVPNGHYKLFIDLVNGPQGCDFSVWQRQTKVTNWIETKTAAGERLPQLYVGDIEVTDSQTSVTLHFKPNGEGKRFFLNRFILVKK